MSTITNTRGVTHSWPVILSTGFAMFSMFFGAGNLIFPITIGAFTSDQYIFASVGFILTGIIVPCLGLLSIVATKGCYESFFAILGRSGSFLVPLLLMLVIGPFGATPRAIAVSYGSFLTIFPEVNVYLYALAAAILLYYLAVNRSELVPNIGYYLTPILLFLLLLIVTFGIFDGGQLVPSAAIVPSQSISHGLHEGYQTMDLLATYFFAVILIDYIRSKVGEDACSHSVKSMTMKSITLGAICLTTVYLAFIYLGAIFAEDVMAASPDQALAIIAHKIFGPFGAPVVCLAYILACLTTAVALIGAFSEYVHENIFQEKISLHTCVVGSVVISCVLSTLRFTDIISYLGPIVQVMYPGLILVTILSLLRPYYEIPHIKYIFFLVFMTNGIYVLFA